MARPAEYATFRTLSQNDRQAIGAVIESKYRIKLAQDQAREDLKAVAENLGMKSSELNRVIKLAMQERERGNILVHEKALIEVAEQVVSDADRARVTSPLHRSAPG